MPGSSDASAARRFHDRTAHTPASVRTSGHSLDWDVKPFPFKVYTDRPAVPLPRTFDPVTRDTLEALASVGAPDAALTLERLACLLYLTAGVTKKKVYGPGAEVLFRAAASTGALYQTEVYVASGTVDGLAPGLYHFCPGDFTLRRLRDGDVRGALARAAADPDLGRRAAVVVLSAIYWRNTWKYQARGFRHLFWDSGTMLANLVATGSAVGLRPSIVTGFVDRDVDRLLGIDPHRETALVLVDVGPPVTAAPDAPAIDTIAHETLPLSSSEVDYPALREMVEASSLDTPDAVAAWRGGDAPAPRAATGTLVALPSARARAGRSLTETIQRRGSTRQFARVPLDGEHFATALWATARPTPADVPSGLVEAFVIVSAVDGLQPGAYRYLPPAHALETIKVGEFRNEAGYLCLEQPLAADAAAVIFFLAPLDALLARWGNRGYRLANLEAGLAGGRAYLAAYALGFGASGLTFYDRLVVEFFAPASGGLDAVFVTALGQSVSAPRASVFDRLSRARTE
jgi:SagB-type dehydrogenase family enzyme